MQNPAISSLLIRDRVEELRRGARPSTRPSATSATGTGVRRLTAAVTSYINRPIRAIPAERHAR